MIKIHLFRHAESLSDAGDSTSCPSKMPLSTTGRLQAEQWAKHCPITPSLIVTSPYLRAKQTARYILNRFPLTAVQVWDIHEFTYLMPSRCKNTTPIQRKAWVNEYWQRNDPLYQDGKGAESFLNLIKRVDMMLVNIRSLTVSNVIIISHEQFMNAFRWRVKHPNRRINKAAMISFRRYNLDNSIRNCAGFVFKIS